MEPITPWRVLVVDDNESFAYLTARVVDDDPRFTVVGSARSLGEAAVSVEAQQPDLVVLDHALPDAWGAQAVHCLKQLAPDLRVVMCSASERCPDADELEIDEWVDKLHVIDLPEILNTVMGTLAT